MPGEALEPSRSIRSRRVEAAAHTSTARAGVHRDRLSRYFGQWFVHRVWVARPRCTEFGSKALANATHRSRRTQTELLPRCRFRTGSLVGSTDPYDTSERQRRASVSPHPTPDGFRQTDFAVHAKRSRLRQSGQAIEDERTRNGHVEARSLSDHRNFDHLIEQRPRVIGHSMMFVPEEDHGSSTRRFEARERHRVVRELNRDDCTSQVLLIGDPAQLRTMHPMNVRSTAQCVTPVESPAIMRRIGNCHARARGVAGTEQCPEVRFEGDPKWRDD